MAINSKCSRAVLRSTIGIFRHIILSINILPRATSVKTAQQSAPNLSVPRSDATSVSRNVDDSRRRGHHANAERCVGVFRRTMCSHTMLCVTCSASLWNLTPSTMGLGVGHALPILSDSRIERLVVLGRCRTYISRCPVPDIRYSQECQCDETLHSQK